ncbi:Anaphase-promoting complex subunit 4 WD40 domain-containing protein [Plasmodiophora brassicae]|uniref:Anaphase-promoting complex subunit 4 WD40 domain-containing protein n=1 Tax=Plasmodiophora brassicae TaxID=37360 RepID=A0A3P3YLV1_PLABS|nr:unnamed protein product [Plasmodiophora brassicae]
MDTSAQFSSRHAAHLSDLAYDFYGQRIATCSADHLIKVWGKSAPGQQWTVRSTIEGRNTFNRITWAHPEFGQILAACSSDYNVVIYEEIVEGNEEESQWIERARLVDSHGEVQALEFGPRHLGLQLATLGEDGICRIYEAVDMMQMSLWPIRDEFNVSSKGSGPSSTSSLSWNTSQFQQPQIVIGCLDLAQIWQYSSEHRRWLQICELSSGGSSAITDVSWAPSLARSFDLIAVSFTGSDTTIYEVKSPAHVTQTWTIPAQCCRLSWNLTGTSLATSSSDGTVQIWHKSADGKWVCSQTVDY